MSGRSLKLFTLALALATAATASTIKDDETLKKISKYRDWSRVTQKPISVDFSSAGG
jgi:hypothetical protein